ncbi:MAG: ABC transporter substrate binding protein, partial [Actinomycetia bacterium]|nr:ABC transporter substrate binding protein [Actinomycetes bacterium]
EKTVTATGEVGQAAAALGTDAVYVPTDNTVVSGLASVVQVCEQKKLPLVVGEGDSVAKGGAITYGIDYSQLGYQTGQMAVRILTQQAKPATMPVEKQKDLKVYVNQAAAQRMGLTVPDALLEGAEVVG